MDKRKIANLVVHGVGNKKIALAIGKSESYIHALINTDPETRELIAEVAAARSEADVMKDLTIERIETNLLNQVNTLVSSTDSLGEATRALKDITTIKATRRAAGMDPKAKGKISIDISPMLALQLNIDVNSANEIETINGKIMAPMPTGKVVELVSKGKPRTIQDVLAGEGSV